MNIDAKFRPIDRWPDQLNRRRQRSRFKAGWSDTLDLLKRELRQLRAKDIVIQLAITEDEIRLDGYPRANARPEHPGVILAFDSKHGPLKYATDAFTDWQDNIRAIALGLEALRKVDRYGITKRGEQYTGWRALPGASGEPTTLDEAARVLSSEAGNGTNAGEILAHAEHARRAIRKALASAHPDRGGSGERFHAVQGARKVVEAHHGLDR